MRCTSVILLVLVALPFLADAQTGSRSRPPFGKPFLTSETGHHVGSNQHSQSITPSGPLLLQHIYTLEKLRRFNTERIPERVVHARGAVATGYFESAVDLSALTASDIFSARGRKTDVVVRFSTVVHGKHSPETLRDPRGFAVKFKSAVDGNWDLLGNNLPVFFIRDHIKFPDMVHSLKPDPVTNIQDPNRFFDFFAALGGMATNMLTYLYSDLGTPASYRTIEGHSVHAYKFVNSAGKVTYVKFRWVPHAGVHNLTRSDAQRIQANDFNHATRDLNDAIIKRRDYPKWTLQMQRMSVADLDKHEFNPLDATKIWPEHRFPFSNLGTMTLNAIPPNFHMGSEQSAFAPGNFPPGRIEPSEDKLLQGRLISYHETQVHRHRSTSFQDLPINRPRAPVRNYNQDGVMTQHHAWTGSVNYEPSLGQSDLQGQQYRHDPSALMSKRDFCGSTVQQTIHKTLNFKQAGELYRSLSKQDQDNLIANIASELGVVNSMLVRNTMCAHFYRADETYGKRVCKAVSCQIAACLKIAKGLSD